MNDRKRILYVCDKYNQQKVLVDELAKQFDVDVPGFDGELYGRSVPVDMAIRRLYQKNFDLVMTGMVLAVGYEHKELGGSLFNTGELFINLIRQKGYDGPVLVYEMSTGLEECHYNGETNRVVLASGE